MLHHKTIAPLLGALLLTICNVSVAQRLEVPAARNVSQPQPEARTGNPPRQLDPEPVRRDSAVRPAQYTQGEPTIFSDFESFTGGRFTRDLNVRPTRLPKVWEFSAGAIFWNREASDTAIVRVNDTSPDSSQLLGSEAFNERQTGYELLARNERMELRYFTVDSIAKTFNAPAGTFGSIVTAAGNEIEYQSSLDNIEANLFFFQSTNVRLLAGFRHITLNEEVTLDVPGNRGLFGVHTENDMYGVQLGADTLAYLMLDGRAAIRTGVKAGVYMAHTEVENTSRIPGVRDFDTDDVVSFAGEYYLSLHYQLYSWLEFDIGYHVLWLNGVALAGEQIRDRDAANTEFTANHGSTLFHGLKLGLTANW